MQAKTKKWMKRVCTGSALALVLGGGLAFYLLQRPPAVWREAQQVMAQTTPAQRAELTDGVIQRLSTAMDQLDINHGSTIIDAQALANQPVDETFEIELSNEELLSVASGWADEWVAQRGYEVPEQVDQPIVMIRKGRLMIAFELTVGSWRQVFAGRVAMRFDPDGMAHGSVSELTAGSLPMPAASVGGWVAKQLPASDSELADQIGQWVAELEGFAFRPVLELEHRRRARVIAMTLRDDSLLMKVRLQDHETYKQHNTLLEVGSVAVSDALHPALLDGSAIADVPTTTD